MIRKGRFCLLAVFGSLLLYQSLEAGELSSSRSKTVLPALSGWVVYWDDPSGRPAVLQGAPALEEVAVFSYAFDSEGRLIPSRPTVDPLRKWMKQNLPKGHPRLLITVVNDVIQGDHPLLKDAACVHRALSTPELRAAHIRQLMDVAAEDDGLEIDYENLDPNDRGLFTLFIQELAHALHERHQWLSIVAEPHNDRALDWAALAPSVDRFKIMAYLYHYAADNPGSIAPTDWVIQLAVDAQRVIPAEKICIVLHMGGLDWAEHVHGEMIDFDQASRLAKTHQTKIVLDAASGSGTFQYVDQNITHTVWIEEADGLRRKIFALSRQGIHHIALWRIGTGDPAFWDWLRRSQ